MQRAPIERTWTGIGWIIGLVLFSTGCTFSHATYLSNFWIEQPHGLYPASIHHRRPILQVIITYDGPLSSHAALRLVSNHGNVTFWDPAGAYGLRSGSAEAAGRTGVSPITRVKDLVLSGIPDIHEYVQFRWDVGDVTVEVYEWDVEYHDAQRLEEILHGGTQETGGSDVFQTQTAPALCTVAISQFLQRFAKPILTISDWYLWPHNLAQVLLEQRPTRIRVFHQNQRELIYIPPHRSAGQARFRDP